MIAALVVLFVAALLLWLDTMRIERNARKGPLYNGTPAPYRVPKGSLHEADVRAAGNPNGHVDIVGGRRVR